MDQYTRGQIKKMRDKMKYLIEYDTSKGRDDNQLLQEEKIIISIPGKDPQEGESNEKDKFTPEFVKWWKNTNNLKGEKGEDKYEAWSYTYRDKNVDPAQNYIDFLASSMPAAGKKRQSFTVGTFDKEKDKGTIKESRVVSEGKEAKNFLQVLGNYKGHKFDNGEVIKDFDARGDQLEIKGEKGGTGIQYDLTKDFWYTPPTLSDNDKAFLLSMGQDKFGSKLTKIQESRLTESKPKDIVERLSTALSLKEWGLVEEVLNDLLEDAKPRVFSPEEEAEIEMWRDRKR
tara:strand:+ start:344 stop:1201 length:858 start_codon:yes stop_codon:yes gene_type:complete